MHKLHVNYFFLIFTGFIVVGLSVWVTILIVRSVYGRVEMKDLLPTQESLGRIFTSEGNPVAILYSGYSEQAVEQGGTWQRENVNTWEHYITSIGMKADVIGDSTIELGRLERYKLVILPGSRALSDREITVVKEYLEHGGSIFATSGTGSYRENGEWRGWEFLSEVYGIQFIREINPEESTRIHTLRGGLPVTAGIPTGYSLKVATWDRPMACEVLEPRTTQASFWYNFRSDSGLVREALEKTAGIVYGSYGKGRFVWMGFELSSVLGDQNDYIYFDRLCRHSIEWLMVQPTVVIKDWPAPFGAAATLVPVLSKEFSNTQNLLKVVALRRVPVTFFVDPEVAKLQQPLVRMLAGQGELGAMVDFGSPGAGLPEGEMNRKDVRQSTSLAAKAALEQIADTRVTGAFSRQGSSDEKSVLSLMANGYEYLVMDSVLDRAVPKTVTRGEKAFVSISKTVRDDNDVITDFGLTNPEFQLFTYKEGVDRVVFQGGLYTLVVHSHLQCRPEYISVVNDLLEYIQSKNFWIATAKDVSRWWLLKNALEVSVKARTSRRVSLVVSNPSRETIENVGIEVGLNKRFANLEITSDIIGTEIPKYKADLKRQLAEITIRKLAGGESVSYFLDYDNVEY